MFAFSGCLFCLGAIIRNREELAQHGGLNKPLQRFQETAEAVL
jgi:hypothetical protein